MPEQVCPAMDSISSWKRMKGREMVSWMMDPILHHHVSRSRDEELQLRNAERLPKIEHPRLSFHDSSRMIGVAGLVHVDPAAPEPKRPAGDRLLPGFGSIYRGDELSCYDAVYHERCSGECTQA